MNDNLSRIEKFGRRRQGFRQTEPIQATSYEEHDVYEDYNNEMQEARSTPDIPSRRETYPSQRLKITRLFFNFLLFIFVAILFMLLWWGISESPWGKVHM